MQTHDPRANAAKVPSSEIQKALDASVGVRLQKILPALVSLYLALSIKDFVLGTAVLGWLALATGTAALIFWLRLRRDLMAARQVHLFACAIGVLVCASFLADFYLDPSAPPAVIMLLLAGAAFALSSWRCYLFLAVLSVTGWLGVAAFRQPLFNLVYGSLNLMIAAAIAGWGMRLRLQRQYQIQKDRLEEAEHKLIEQSQRERFNLAVKGTDDGFWYWDLKSNVLEVSSSWAAMLGFEKGELGTTPEEWLDRVHPGYVSKLRTELSAHLYGEAEQFRDEHRIRRKDGTYIWVLARGKAVRNDAGEAVGLAGSHADITPLIEVENRLLTDAFQDQLTGLPNRHFLASRLESLMEEKRSRGLNAPLFAVLFVDLDRFKIVNDSLGHLVGDQLLAAVASRLRNSARPGDIVARFGGDEFVILLERLRDPEEALIVGSRIRKSLTAPFLIGDREVSTGASIGIVLSTEEVSRTEDILRYADMAMYHAKSQGKGQVQLFNENMQVQITKLCDLQNDLRRALARQELELHYQPYVSTRSGKVLGVEALARWRQSDRLILQPSDFIPLAEEIGLINDIGEWALRSACAQNRAWQEAGISPVRMAVNISPRQLQQKDFAQKVLRILDETGLQPQWLELELTETALMDNLDLAPSTLDHLGSLGIRTSIDDFGTGYSSLNYLRRFNFQTLKMDRCFVSDVTTDNKAAAVAKGLILLAHNLNLSVIAEGVERTDQLAFLTTEGCDHVQGFLAARPVPAEELTELLRLGDVKESFFPGNSSAMDLHRAAAAIGAGAKDPAALLV